MSVQKFTIKKKKTNFTQIHNSILQGLKNYEALGLYCYIASLPPEWQFHKNHLAHHAGIGRDKLSKLLNILENHGLVKIEQIRDENGRFSNFNMHVYDEEEFIFSPDSKEKSPFTEKPLTDNRLPENSIYKEDKKKEYKKQKKDIERSAPKRATRIDDNFEPNDSCIQLAVNNNISVSVEVPEFIDYYKSIGKPRLDWQATFRNWIRKEIKFRKDKKSNNKTSKSPLKQPGDVNAAMEYARNYAVTHKGS